MQELCLKPLKPREKKYTNVVTKQCHLTKGHNGECKQYPFVEHLKTTIPKAQEKVIRDSENTTGAAWKSDDAGPNRIPRWVMLLSDDELLRFGLDMSALKPGVVNKLREKAATYDKCVEVAMKLTWLVYQMEDAPTPPDDIKKYLEEFLGPMTPGSTVCEVCRTPLSVTLFDLARVGKGEIETCHKDPRFHDANNVGFSHRRCNIAQGDRPLSEFYDWIEEILSRLGRI